MGETGISRRAVLSGKARDDAGERVPVAGGEFHVCGLVVHVRPDRLDAVADALGSLSGVELHARSPQGKVVITLEARTQDDVVRTMAGIADMPGVLSTALVYQHAEADGHSAT